jgi:TrmH family RNA methyltransferase
LSVITSLQNQRVKNAIKLRDRRERQKQGRIVIDGARELLRAINAGVNLVEVFVCEELCQSPECRKLLAHSALRTPHSELLSVGPAVFEKLAYGQRAEGVVGVARTPSTTLADLALPPDPLIAVLEGVEKPGNVGAVLRSADAAGVSALIVADGGTDLYNPNAIRASLGTIFTVPVCVASSADTVRWLAERGIAIYTARVDAELEYTQADFTRPCAIVLGSEAQGLTDQWRSKPSATGSGRTASGATCSVSAVTSIKLPMLGVADSLNVSTAAAVLFYEALRQRRSRMRNV